MNEVRRSILLIVLLVGTFISVSSKPSNANALTFNEKLDRLLISFDTGLNFEQQKSQQIAYLDAANIRFENCQDYPYHSNQNHKQGYKTLSSDIKKGLKQGLQCLSGQGPMGKLHSYHEEQAIRLLKILESDRWKTFRCVKDQTFAYAVANTPPDPKSKKSLADKITKDLPYPGVVLDTFRISGFISDKHDETTYREFFKLNEEQIKVLSTGKPLRIDGMHRYKNRPALMFHEMVHWLGHEHSGINPDITHLYETCCFTGSDYIDSPDTNKKFQQQACNILKDKELWQATPYRKMRLWRYKEYDQLKRNMRRHEEQ